MDIQLSPELERVINNRVHAGRYHSASEVVGEALRLLDQFERLEAFRKEDVQQKIAAGLASLRAGKSVDGESVFERIEAELDEMERNGHK